MRLQRHAGYFGFLLKKKKESQRYTFLFHRQNEIKENAVIEVELF